MSKISVILVEDQASTRQGLKTMLSFLTTDIDVIAEAVTADEAVQKALHHRPDVVLMDFHIPSKFSVLQDGFSATKAICYDWPEARVLIVTNHDGDENIDSARNAGARGYILKDAEFDEIAKAIRALHQGKNTSGARLLLR